MYFMQLIVLCIKLLHAQSLTPDFATPWTIAGQAPPSMEFPSNTGVVSHSLLQGIFPSQSSNQPLLSFLNWQVDSLTLHHLGIPIYKITICVCMCIYIYICIYVLYIKFSILHFLCDTVSISPEYGVLSITLHAII